MSERLDMSEFEAQFKNDRLNSSMTNDDFERLAFLNERIREIDDVTELREETKDELELSAAEINGLLAILREIEKKLVARRVPMDLEQSALSQAIRHDKRNKEALERERLRLLQEIAAQQKFLAQREALFSSIANKPWAVGIEENGKVKKALPHQYDGAHRLVSAGRALLGDKPGLGKTLEAIMTIDMLRAEGKGQKVLVFTPKSVVPDFKRAFDKWTDPTLVFTLDQAGKGIKVDVLNVIEHMPEIILITNYEVWRKDRTILDKLKACGFDTVILDEAHVLNNAKSRTSKDIKELIYAENKCPKCGYGEFANRGTLDRFCGACEYMQTKLDEFCSIKNVYPMTGTPVLNKPHELFPLLNLIDRNGFPDEKAFLNDYCHKEYDYRTEKYVWTFGRGGSEKLLKKLGMKYTARNRDSAGVVMPPQEIKHHWLELDPEVHPRQHEFNALLRDKAKLAFGEGQEVTQNEAFAWYTRFRQAISWPDGIKIKGCPHSPECENEWGEVDKNACYAPEVIFPKPGTPPIGESVLMDEAEGIVFEAVEDGDRIVIFSHFRSTIDELEKRCMARNLRVGKITGDVPQLKRQEYIDDFNTNYTAVGEHNYDVLICQYKTASVGLNLNGAQQLLMIEREWNPGKEQQTMDRVRRLDSDYETIVHVLHCEGTATELIDAIQEQKKNMIDGFEADVDLAEAMRKFLES